MADRRQVDPPPPQFAAHRPELNRTLRAAFLAGNEEQFRAEHGRGLTEAELRRVMEQYPGDLPLELLTEE